MAVYQISKIQIRRGKSRSGPGFPQLASGEMGWAVDTQELYIGNGSISEGAPTVGNTKILTSKDIVGGGSGLINSLEHTYKSQDGTITTGPNTSFPIVRKLQLLLDDNAYTSSFGAVGDGTTDDTFAIQRAINQLYANLNLKSFLDTGDGVKRRVELKMPAGIFIITDALVIPSYTTIIGAGIDKTIIRYTGLTTAVRFSADADSTYTNTRPRFINIKGVTIQSVELATIGLDITNVTDSSFSDIKLVGNWSIGTSLDNKGINIANSERLTLNNIHVQKFYYGVYVSDLVYNVELNTGSISSTNYGVSAGVDVPDTQPGVVNLHISNINFNEILANGLRSFVGLSNSITNCSFTSVGGDNTIPQFPQLYFELPSFSCSNIRSDRSSVLSGTSSLLPIYIPEVSGSGSYTSASSVATLVVTPTSSTAFRLPLRTDNTGLITGTISYNINYVFNGTFSRQGTISITANSVSVVSSEEYTCNTTSEDGIKLDFLVDIVDSSINVSYTNDLSDNTGTLTYSYTSNF